MSKTNVEKNERSKNGDKNFVLFFIYRTPKRNYQAIIDLNSRFRDEVKKLGGNGFEVFQLDNGNDMMDFVNIAKTVSATPDEDVWLEINSFRDQAHLEEVFSKMMADENMKGPIQQFLNLLTPGSRCSYGEFSRVSELNYV